MKRGVIAAGGLVLLGAVSGAANVLLRVFGIKAEMRKHPTMFDGHAAAAMVKELADERAREMGL